MPKVEKLTQAEIEARLAKVPGWSLDGQKLYRELKFSSFVAAFDFMKRVATVAEELQHHPEWFNVYSTVRIHLTTHDAGGISALDFSMAQRMNELFEASK
jgi:4a-hydroxytetrahydrobiopterin dehydratase